MGRSRNLKLIKAQAYVEDFWQNVNLQRALHVTKWPLSVLHGSSPLQHMQTTADAEHTTAARPLFCLTQNLNLSIFCDNLSTGQHGVAQTERGDRQRNSTIAFRRYVSGNSKCTRIQNKIGGKNVRNTSGMAAWILHSVVGNTDTVTRNGSRACRIKMFFTIILLLRLQALLYRRLSCFSQYETYISAVLSILKCRFLTSVILVRSSI